MEVQKKKKKRAPLVTGRRRKSARLWLLVTGRRRKSARLWLLEGSSRASGYCVVHAIALFSEQCN
jgi:hypothetical protein